jgi:immune inhibitor A
MDTSFNQPAPSSNQSSSMPKIIGAIIGILVCCSCIAIAAAGVFAYRAYQNVDIPTILTPFAPPLENTVTPVPTVQIDRPPVEDVSRETLETLEQAQVPENDPYEIACRLQAVCNVSQKVQAKSYSVGDKEKFWIVNSDTNEHSQIDTTLRYITPHSYFWVEDGTPVDETEMQTLMDTFEEKIYPTDREFFGSEANPGVDGDPHIYVLYANSIGHNIAGYFSSSDSYNPLVKEFSNGHETYVLGTSQDLGDPYTYATLAHEFVHMIQNASDRNDVSWMNEGFAEVGSFLNGYYSGGADWLYVQNPDIQLNTWVDNASPDFSAHYGQSFLYLAYFLDRFGEEASKALTNNPENDLTSVDATLAELNITDPQTGTVITADDVFMDWAVTLHLMDKAVGDGRYSYNNYPSAPRAEAAEPISSCPQSVNSTVNQYGIDYYTITCEGDYTIHFKGSTVVGLLPTDPNSANYTVWSNRGDESDMTITREFDFSGVSGPITMSFAAWYDIETDYDYAYLEASTDGETWEILTTPSGTGEDPTGQNYGWAYNSQTNSWITEEVDLSQFAGQKVQLRFEYITDAALNGEGFLLDDVRIDAINYQEDFEVGDGGWEGAGFVRVENVLPQTYRLALITKGDTTTVTHIQLNPDQTVDIPLSLNAGEEAVLVVAGTTRFTRLPAAYQIDIE